MMIQLYAVPQGLSVGNAQLAGTPIEPTYTLPSPTAGDVLISQLI